MADIEPARSEAYAAAMRVAMLGGALGVGLGLWTAVPVEAAATRGLDPVVLRVVPEPVPASGGRVEIAVRVQQARSCRFRGLPGSSKAFACASGIVRRRFAWPANAARRERTWHAEVGVRGGRDPAWRWRKLTITQRRARPPVPTIRGFSSASGAPGGAVTISGANLTGASVVAFNGVTASYTVVSATRISAIVPLVAGTGPITVTTPGGTAASTSSFSVTPRSVTTGAFQVQWSLSDPEEITSLSWNGSPNLTNSWTNRGQCPGNPDLEFFGNAWGLGPAGVHSVAVGGGTTGSWSSQASQGSIAVDIASAATGCPPQTSGIPVATSYQFPSSGNVFSVARTFSFGTTPFTSDLRPYIPRLYPGSHYTVVYFPTTSGTLSQANGGACEPTGCKHTDWNGSWFAITNRFNGHGVIVKRNSPRVPVALWVDANAGSATSSMSVLLLAPHGGFTGTVVEAESLCFYKSWTPSLTLPAGCRSVVRERPASWHG